MVVGRARGRLTFPEDPSMDRSRSLRSTPRAPRVALVALAVVLLPAALFAQAQGRMYGFVTDVAGKPVEGARIIISAPEKANFKVEAKSDKKGKYSLAVLDATRTYTLRIEKEGYQPQEGPYKFAAFATTKVDIQLAPANAAAPVAAPMAPAPRMAPEDAAKAEAQRAAAQTAQSAIVAYNEGAQLFNSGDVDGAIAKFELAAQTDPKLAPAPSILARLYVQKQVWDKAAAAAESALALDPTDAKAAFARFEAYQALGDKEKSQAAFADLQRIDPKGAASSLYDKGKALFDAGQVEAAVKTLNESATLDPTHARVHYQLGLCYANTGEYGKAKAELKRFIELAPEDPEAAVAQEMLKGLR